MNRSFPDCVTKLFDWLTGEPVLEIFGANGGTVVALRAMWTTFFFALLAVLVVSAFDPKREGPASWIGAVDTFWSVSNHVALFLGASYLALYARFVSQWSYLAGLYNLIKQAEAIRDVNRLVIAEWKAGYLEDAENLHLAGKNNLAPVLHSWAQEAAVAESYIKNTPGGVERLERLRAIANSAFAAEERRVKRKLASRRTPANRLKSNVSPR